VQVLYSFVQFCAGFPLCSYTAMFVIPAERKHFIVISAWKHNVCCSMYNVVLLMMNTRRSKHVEDKKNWIKTLIRKCIFLFDIT
jgi:hypothetical protein